MTPDRLRQLADAATPGPWEYAPDAKSVWGAAGNVVVGPHPDAAMRGVGVTKAWVASTGLVAVDRTRADARLIAALGPDAARLLADAMDFIEAAICGCRPTNDPPFECWRCVLLARFAALGEDTP